MYFPDNLFVIGDASATVAAQQNLQQTTQQVVADAKKNLVENIRVRIVSEIQNSDASKRVNGKEQIVSYHAQNVMSFSDAEIVGIKTETYFDPKTKTISAFAYANKYEIIGYYKNSLSVNITQAESFVRTAQDLEAAGEKAKARQELERAMPLFDKIRTAQDLLTALDTKLSADDLQQAKTETLYNNFVQMQARLAQAVYVFISGNENLFGKTDNIIANKVKADLAHKGCSFVENSEQADFSLKINADVRLSSQNGGIVFCYVDVEVELFDNHKQKAVFGDEFSEKGGSSSQEKAGRKAMETAANKVAEKLINWIQ